MTVMIVCRRVDRVQTGPLLGGRVRISHPYICQTRSAQAMRLCMTEYLTTTTEAARFKRQQPNKVGGGSWWRVWPRQSQGHEEDQFTSASEDDWLEEGAGYKPIRVIG